MCEYIVDSTEESLLSLTVDDEEGLIFADIVNHKKSIDEIRKYIIQN
jgi:hypothetical protein